MKNSINLATQFPLEAVKIAASVKFSKYSVEKMAAIEIKAVWQYTGKVEDARNLLSSICEANKAIQIENHRYYRNIKSGDSLSFSASRKKNERGVSPFNLPKLHIRRLVVAYKGFQD